MTQAKREQVMVGLFVLIAAALLVGTVFALGGMTGQKVKTRQMKASMMHKTADAI